MKRVLFIGVTKYDLVRDTHLEQKFQGLSQEIKPYVLAKGKPFHKKIWNTDFYLLPSFLFWLSAFRLAIWLCLFKKIDTIISQSPLIEGLVGTILKKLFRKELIVEIHGDWQEGPFLSKKRRLAFIQRKFVPVLARISLKSADKIRAISNFTAAKAKEIAPNKPYFIFPTFTDINSFLEEENVKFENYILFVGQLQKVKGIEYLIEAFSQITKEFPDFKLILVGEGPEKQKYQSVSNIEFKGRLSLKETKDIMKDCYCLVLPSLSEGLGRVLIEAMALRKPVIGSNVGGIPDLIENGQNGFLFEPGNASQLTEKLRTLLQNRNLAMEIGKKGRELIQNKFSNEKYIANYLEMINM